MRQLKRIASSGGSEAMAPQADDALSYAETV